jgi:hypothetical protein
MVSGLHDWRLKFRNGGDSDKIKLELTFPNPKSDTVTTEAGA